MSTELKLAGHGKRIAAFLIDNTICGVAAQFILKKMILPFLPSEYVYIVAFIFLLVVFPVLYWVLLTLYFGATPAKKMLNLKIVTADGISEPTFRMLFVREVVARLISGLALGLGYFWAFYNKDRRSWHDIMSRTRVVSLSVGKKREAWFNPRPSTHR